MITVVPTISVHPNQICLYNSYIKELPFKHFNKRSFDNLQDNTKKIAISSKSKSKINRAITYLYHISNLQTQFHHTLKKNIIFRLTFVTLTLPSKQIHTDKEIKEKCLNQFLVELRKYYKVEHYIWRLEYQKNGNIHFHILFNRFINHTELRDRWNRIINKLGYVDRYREQLKEIYKNGFVLSTNKNDTRTRKQQYQAYVNNLKHDFSSPNTTDIHSLRLIANIQGYISKYMNKNESAHFDKGNNWQCSESLSNIKGAVADIDSSISNDIGILRRCDKVRKFDDKYFSVLSFDYKLLTEMKCFELLNLLNEYLLKQFNYNTQLTLNNTT